MAKKFDLQKQDLTGHVTLIVSRMKFLEEINHKTTKVAALRTNGMLPDKRDRNPILAQKTSRPDHRGFDFYPPAKEPEPEKWVYPDSDWGLMAKFRSQQPIYDDIFRREKEYNTRMAELYRIREENQLKIDKELQKQQRMLAKERDARERAEKARMDIALHNTDNNITDSDPGNSGRHSHRHHHHNHGHHHNNGIDASADELDQSLAADRREAERRARQKLKKGASHFMENIHHEDLGMPTHRKPPNDLSEMKVSEIRDLNTVQPDVLKKWRAQRAAEFISTKKNALDVAPPQDTVHTAAFRPGGISTLKPNSAAVKKKGRSGSGGYAQTLYEAGADTVREELRRTEADIARTELKIKLNTKPQKSYNKTT